MSLREVVGTMGRGGSAPPSGKSRMSSLPRANLRLDMPLALVPRAAKRVLATLSDWSLIRQEHLTHLLGVRRSQFYSLRKLLLSSRLVVAMMVSNPGGRRFALSDAGIRILAYREG